MRVDNPFNVTKAVDFTNVEIAETFVDLPKGGFSSLASPAGSMPTYLVGGKGGGRTHLLRYYSFPLQEIRSHEAEHASIVEHLRTEGYVGIYFRCGGLNSNRFRGKGQSPDTWASIFAQYMDLWLSELYLDALLGVIPDLNSEDESGESEFVRSAASLLSPAPTARNTRELRDHLARVRADYDRDINNSAITRELNLIIVSSPGDLVFRLPQLAAQHLRDLDGIIVNYLIDELENLTADQQRYINTLVREKQLPCNFTLGSRLHGLRTMATLSADEENKQGSEYDLVVLEDQYRARRGAYSDWCRKVVTTRLAEAGYPRPRDKTLSSLFSSSEPPEDNRWRDVEALGLVGQDSLVRPHMRRLVKQLDAFGMSNSSSTEIVELLQSSAHPLVEKFAVSRFYRKWAHGDNLPDAAFAVQKEILSLLLGDESGPILTRWQHWRDDLLAQLYVENNRYVPYEGMDTFIRMSGFLPRNLLVVLKRVTRWALYLDERPFLEKGAVSREAQSRGVREAATWFLSDRKALGELGEDAQLAMRRLASFFRQFRYADKPTEVSLCTFSTDRRDVSRRALDVLDNALVHNLLIEVKEGTRHRNTAYWHNSYQLNPMIAPLFDLPIARRGVLPMKAEELEVIFSGNHDDGTVSEVTSRRINSMNAPFSALINMSSQQDRLL